jgi:MarR family transcriptional regulator, organic hydroperoxide resistance regulator
MLRHILAQQHRSHRNAIMSRKLQDSLPYLISRAASRLGALKDQILTEFGLGLTEWRVLIVLADEDGKSISDLAKVTLTELSTLSRQLDAMEARGLVEKRRARANARTVTVHLTTAGQTLYKRTLPAEVAYDKMMQKDISAKDLEIARRVLAKVHENILTHPVQQSSKKIA